MRATEEVPAAFDAVPDDLAFTVLAYGSQLVDRAFEAVEDVPVSRCDYLETEFIHVAANFTRLLHACETRLLSHVGAITVTERTQHHSRRFVWRRATPKEARIRGLSGWYAQQPDSVPS